MITSRAVEVIRTEKKCVLRNIRGCSRECEKCDLVLPDEEILQAYDMAVSALLYKEAKVKEKFSMVDDRR
jgi:hypothetical protein